MFVSVAVRFRFFSVFRAAACVDCSRVFLRLVCIRCTVGCAIGRGAGSSSYTGAHMYPKEAGPVSWYHRCGLRVEYGVVLPGQHNVLSLACLTNRDLSKERNRRSRLMSCCCGLAPFPRQKLGESAVRFLVCRMRRVEGFQWSIPSVCHCFEQTSPKMVIRVWKAPEVMK